MCAQATYNNMVLCKLGEVNVWFDFFFRTYQNAAMYMAEAYWGNTIVSLSYQYYLIGPLHDKQRKASRTGRQEVGPNRYYQLVK